MDRSFNKKVVLGLSGGVDSSVAAYLLKKQGYEVLGVFMQNWEDEDADGNCSIKTDALDAIAAADCMGIDIEFVNFSKVYQERVFSYFLAEHAAGRTPNPDIICNSEIKFKSFWEYAKQLGADYLATGHYAQHRRHHSGESQLVRASDDRKDQSYFLYRLNQAQLHPSLFPLGMLQKSQVRQIARTLGLPNAEKKDSTGICFIGERPFRSFLSAYFPKNPGLMTTPEGKKVGEHIGLMYYTLGQRYGLGIGGKGLPWYVADKALSSNTLIVVQGNDHPLLVRSELIVHELSWVASAPPPLGLYTAKVRYRQRDAPCELIELDSHHARLSFLSPQWAVTPGQSLVLYDHDVCLGGGTIQQAVA